MNSCLSSAHGLALVAGPHGCSESSAIDRAKADIPSTFVVGENSFPQRVSLKQINSGTTLIQER